MERRDTLSGHQTTSRILCPVLYTLLPPKFMNIDKFECVPWRDTKLRAGSDSACSRDVFGGPNSSPSIYREFSKKMVPGSLQRYTGGRNGAEMEARGSNWI